MYKLSQDLLTKLSNFNQRKLVKGEIFLLAKALADELPLMPPDEDSVNLFILNHKRFIEEIIYVLNDYSYLNDEEIKTVFKLISDLTLWRANIAYNPPTILFKDKFKEVIDDISCLPRYVDIVYMCSVGDIINTANYIFLLFKQLVKEVKDNIITDSKVNSFNTEVD